MDRLQLKNRAKESLKGHYWEFYKMILMFLLVSFLVGLVAGILDYVCHTSYVVGEQVIFNQTIPTEIKVFQTIGEVLLSALFTFGIISFSLKISRNEEVTYKELFSKTHLWLFFILVTLLVGIFVSLWSILLIIPGIIATYAYRMVYFIKLDNPDIGVLEAISKSKEIMRGHKLDLFILQLSFIGWIILGAFTFGILYLWLVPYMSITECNFYNSIINK